MAAALAAGWLGAALLIIVIVVPIAAICWILADPGRPHRLALLLTTWRHSGTAQQQSVAVKSRRAIDKPQAER